MTQQKKQLWSQPWGYIESFLLVAALLVGAVLFELIIQLPAPIIAWPVNIIFLSFFASISVYLHFLSSKSSTVRWLSSIPASVGAIVFFVVVSLFMALIPQDTETKSLFILYNVTQSWAYYIAIFYFLIILGMVTIRRLTPINRKNIGFALSHLGLWITLACASLGAGDVHKFTMELKKDTVVWQAYDKNMNAYDMNFAIRLDEFDIDEYPAKLACVHARTGEFIDNNGKKAILELDTIQPISCKNLKITIVKYLKSSVFYNSVYIPMVDYGTTQSCYVSVYNSKTNTTIKGWVGSSSVTQAPTYLRLEDSVVLAMLQPEARKFSSKVTVFEQNGNTFNNELIVNRPIQINGWKVYQTSYDEKKGKWSDVSIVEIVRDPWLPFVYVGLFLMIGGALYIIWFGRKK